MEIHRARQDFALISQAYDFVMKNAPEPLPRKKSQKNINKRECHSYVNISLHKCEVRNRWDVEVPSVVQKPSFNTISTESAQYQHLDTGGYGKDGSKAYRNPYQAKINYFQTAMRNSKINSALAERQESKQKLKTFVKEANTADWAKFIPETPGSQHSQNELQRTMGVSQSVKNQVTLKNELAKENNPLQEFERQIKKLTDRVKKLEKENKKLRDENRRLKGKPSEKRKKEIRPGSHYKPECKKIHKRGDSRTSMHFNQTNNFSDFAKSYSFENNAKEAAGRQSYHPKFDVAPVVDKENLHVRVDNHGTGYGKEPVIGVSF